MSGRLWTGPAAQKPASPDIGDCYFDQKSGALSVYDGSQWVFRAFMQGPSAPGVQTICVGPPLGWAEKLMALALLLALGAALSWALPVKIFENDPAFFWWMMLCAGFFGGPH